MKMMQWEEFSAMYCERQENTPHGLWMTLKRQADNYQPDGWMLLECHQMDSSYFNTLTILPYGPRNTFKEPPTHPVTPRGLASDRSVVIGLLLATGLPAVAPTGERLILKK